LSKKWHGMTQVKINDQTYSLGQGETVTCQDEGEALFTVEAVGLGSVRVYPRHTFWDQRFQEQTEAK